MSFLLCPLLVSSSFLFRFLFYLITELELEIYDISAHEAKLGTIYSLARIHF